MAALPKSLVEFLEKIYYDPAHPAAYGSEQSLLRYARRYFDDVSLENIKTWLQSQPTHTLHVQPNRKIEYRKTIVGKENHQYQADLVDMSSLSKHRTNVGFKFILTVIDCFSRKAWAYPMKNKMAATVAETFSQIFKDGTTPPKLLQTDSGTEFMGKPFQTMLKKFGIYHFVSLNRDIKCAIVERFNRTLKTRMWKHFTSTDSYSWVKLLPKLIEGYNKAYHSSIGMAPSAVNEQNRQQVWQRLYGDSLNTRRKSPLVVGDLVRLLHEEQAFKKGYAQAWTSEIFRISEIQMKEVPTYKVSDLNNEPILGFFYKNELQKVRA